jgi:hypothetical protein
MLVVLEIVLAEINEASDRADTGGDIQFAGQIV